MTKELVFGALVLLLLNEIRLGYFRQSLDFIRNYRPALPLLFWVLTVFFVFLVFYFDSLIRQVIRFHSHPYGRWITEFGGRLGRFDYSWGILIVFYAWSLFRRQVGARLMVYSAILCSLLSSFVCTLLKFVFLRARPYAKMGSHSFFNLKGLVEDDRIFQSFPSGDVVVVAGAAFCFFFFFRQKAWRWVFLLLPLTTAFARIYLNRHWPSDTAISLLLSLIVSKAVSDFMQTRRALFLPGSSSAKTT